MVKARIIPNGMAVKISSKIILKGFQYKVKKYFKTLWKPLTGFVAKEMGAIKHRTQSITNN